MHIVNYTSGRRFVNGACSAGVRLEGKAGIALCKKATDRINTSKYTVYREKRRGMDARLKRELLDARVLTAIKNGDFCGYQKIIKDIKSRIPELTPRILHESVEKIVIHAVTDPHSKISRRQEVDIYCKGIGILEMSKVFDSRQERNGIAEAIPFLSCLRMLS